jgi:proteasome accessory factor A
MRVLDEWQRVLPALGTDPASTADRLDWTAKLRVLDGYRDRDSLGWDDPKLRLADLQFHDVDPTRSLYRRLVDRGYVQRLFTDAQIEEAVESPQTDTRAYFRGECVRRYPEAVVAANWDSLVFDVGQDTLKRVPMMDPLRGTQRLVADLLERSPDAATMIDALGGNDG